MSAFGVKRTSTSAAEFHRLYVGAITGAGRAILASRTSASGNNDRAVMEGRDDQGDKKRSPLSNRNGHCGKSFKDDEGYCRYYRANTEYEGTCEKVEGESKRCTGAGFGADQAAPFWREAQAQAANHL
jgi:hypothetical protein